MTPQYIQWTILTLLYIKNCLKWPLKKKTQIGFQDRLSLNAGQKYCRMLSTFIKLPFVIKIFVLSIFKWPLKTGFTVYSYMENSIGLRWINSVCLIISARRNKSSYQTLVMNLENRNLSPLNLEMRYVIGICSY